MNRWLKIGSIAGAVMVGLVVLAVAAFTLLVQPVQARFEARAMEQAFGPSLMGQAEAPFGRMGQFGHPGGPGGFGGVIDHEALLADALGITVEELQAAQEQAHAAGIQQALDEGLISQEQADMMLAQIQLRTYLDREKMTADALGITVEELQAALAEGKTIRLLMNEQGLDPATVRAAIETAHEAAIQQAVTDGVITQEQADQILNGRGFGPGGFGPGGFGPGGFGGRGGFGPGGFGGHR